MIPYVSLKELYYITMRRSSLITIPRLIDFFRFNNEFSQWQVWYGIVRDALDKYNYYYPLYRLQKTYLVVDETHRTARLEDNFEDYLKGIINESQIFLLPGSVVGLSFNPPISSIYPLRDYKYENGEFTDIWYSTNLYYMACLCHYPFPEKFDEKGEPTDQCNVYFIQKDSGTRFKVFKDQLYVELCRYIWNMKQNMQLNNLPVDVFQGLQDDSQRVQSDLDTIYDQALQSSAWIL